MMAEQTGVLPRVPVSWGEGQIIAFLEREYTTERYIYWTPVLRMLLLEMFLQFTLSPEFEELAREWAADSGVAVDIAAECGWQRPR